MILNQSFCRVATVACVAGLLSLAHIGPAAAGTSTRYAARCTAQAAQGGGSASCYMTVPAGKVFIIESATVHGAIAADDRVRVRLYTRFNGDTQVHTFVAGFPTTYNGNAYWTGAVIGTIFSEGPYSAGGGNQIEFNFSRSGFSGSPWFHVQLSGHLEDL